VRLLLDTHVALWTILDDPRLTNPARNLIADPQNVVFVSVVSVWEIAIKNALRRENLMPVSGPEALRYFRAADYQILSITAEHAAAIADLPNHHADPFDRLLVAQAHIETLRIITTDRMVAAYGDNVLLI
jgi:PIN domain nuclease of toxin-antitoxin system